MLKTIILRTVISIACLTAISGIASADTKVKVRQTSGGQTYENTSYIKGKRQRSESNNGQMIIVQQCDLRRNIQIMPQAQAYVIQPYDQPATSTAPSTSATTSQPSPVKKGGVVTSTVTTRDTGERKQIFGYTARHIITSMVMDSSPDSCSPVKNKMEIDGWYIDATFALDCDSNGAYANYRPQASGGCQDRYETKQIGAARKGYPVWEKTTMFGPNGAESFSSINEVIEISQATLDASLFDVPEGYREAKDFASAFSANYGATQPTNAPGDDSHMASPVKNAASQPNNAVPTEVGSKREGVIRIGLATVQPGNVGESMNARDLALAVQNGLAQYLKAPGIELVAMEAKLPLAIESEAKQKECDYVVYAVVSHKKGGGGFGSLIGNSASVVGSNIGYGGSTSAAVAANVATNAIIAESIKAKDEVTLDVKLQVPGGAPAFAKQYKAKAKSAGEDILTSIIEQAAKAMVDVATRK